MPRDNTKCNLCSAELISYTPFTAKYMNCILIERKHLGYKIVAYDDNLYNLYCCSKCYEIIATKDFVLKKLMQKFKKNSDIKKK